MNIENVGVLVTGGASGLGAATAAHFSRSGARVAILDLDGERGPRTAEAIGGIFCKCDVADGPSIEAAIADATAKNGPARILVTCAGIGTAARIVSREGPMPLADFERVIRVNLIGTFNALRIAAAAMTALPETDTGERGVIITTASVAAFEGQIGQAAYAASKGGVAAMTLPAARELARFGIRVLTVAPGLFRTPLLEGLPEETVTGLSAAIPFPARLGEPQEFAELVAALVANPYLNGETIRVDGALRMAPK